MVFVVGGGPSLAGFDFDLLRGRRVLAVNAAGEDVPWGDVLFFKSPDWPGCLPLLARWRGLAVSVSDAPLPREVKRVRVAPPQMPRARTSGQYAVSLAMWMRAARIVLLGFDWNREGGNYHARYDRPGLAYRDCSPERWHGYRERAESVLCEIVNATPGSAIEEFRRVSLQDILCLAPAC